MSEIGITPGSVFRPSAVGLQDPPTRDEETVNRALLNFLDAHYIHEDRNADWESTRKEFVFQSPKLRSREPSKPTPKPLRFVARTDGHLRIHGNEERSAAIIEVKARLRPQDKKKDYTIEMQESAQMALWIFQEPESHWTAPANTSHAHDQETSYQ